MSVRDAAEVAVPAAGPLPGRLAVRPRRALVVAPASLGPGVARAWAQAGSGDGQTALEVEIVHLPSAAGPARDPFGMRSLLPALVTAADADVALVVVPRRRGLARSVPSFVVPRGAPARDADAKRVAVGVVQADRLEDLTDWLGAIRTRRRSRAADGGAVVVAAMGKDRYLDVAGAWAARLEAIGSAVHDVRADRARREALCAELGAGPDVAIYLGHGSDVGWGGYQTVRWRHIAAVPKVAPAGVVIAAACATLRRTRGVVPFGTRLVSSGRVAAYLGAVRLLTNEAVERLGDAIVTELASRRHHDVASLLAAVATDADAELAAVFDAFRLVGDPCTPLPVGGALP